jgi:SAM-dependent methyltransferase
MFQPDWNAIASEVPDLTIRSATPIGEGWTAVAYRVNDDLVFKFPKRPEEWEELDREIAFLAYARPYLRLPVAEHLHRVRDSAGAPNGYAVYRHLPGRAVQPDNLPPRARSALAEALAGFVRALHDMKPGSVASILPRDDERAVASQYWEDAEDKIAPHLSGADPDRLVRKARYFTVVDQIGTIVMAPTGRFPAMRQNPGNDCACSCGMTPDEVRFFEEELALQEAKYLAGINPRQQSGFGRDQLDWERYRRAVTAPIDRDGTFLDVGCANGLLMESVVTWAAEDGHVIEPFGVEISAKLAELARTRLPQWKDRIVTGNALVWMPPFAFDFVRTEMVYVPKHLRRRYVERLLEEVVAPRGCLIICSYGSSRPEGNRADVLVDELREWGLSITGIHDVVSPEHGFAITRAVAVRR